MKVGGFVEQGRPLQGRNPDLVRRYVVLLLASRVRYFRRLLAFCCWGQRSSHLNLIPYQR